MSRHEYISCDVCLAESFKGKRYKCLICNNYDLCERCYENNAASGRHVTTHAMQCLLTKRDCELYYSNEPSLLYSQSFTCPYCGKKGFTDIELPEHVSTNHLQSNNQVICPVCVCNPILRSDVMRDDFIGHLNQEHRTPARDLISFFDEAPRHGMRRIPVPNTRINSNRGRRSNMNSNTQNSRDTSDPFAEFLSQLSGVRRSQAGSSLSAPTTERPSNRTRYIEKGTKKTIGVAPQSNSTPSFDQSVISATSQQTIAPNHSQFLIPSILSPKLSENIRIKLEEERADRCLFLSTLLLNTTHQSIIPSMDEFLDSFVPS